MFMIFRILRFVALAVATVTLGRSIIRDLKGGRSS